MSVVGYFNSFVTRLARQEFPNPMKGLVSLGVVMIIVCTPLLAFQRLGYSDSFVIIMSFALVVGTVAECQHGQKPRLFPQ